MDIPAANDYSAGFSGSALQPDQYSLDRLHAGAREQTPEALRQVAQQFEALFINMMLKNARESGFGDEMFDSDQGKLYQGMFDQQIATNMAQGKGLGLADLLVRQLGGATQESVTQQSATASIYASIASAGKSED
ncbi:MAG: rod-binding protein [Chromatiales bacterium]|jgi:flagellar protein FlgJ|nr:rod-binding protein [Chromatiales bacterium]